MADEAMNGMAYFQLWTPNGQPGITNEADSYIQLRQRPQRPNETEASCSASLRTLPNGSQACIRSNPNVAEWIHDGVWFVLEGTNVTQAQFEATLDSIA
jgi:hypothetical protein